MMMANRIEIEYPHVFALVQVLDGHLEAGTRHFYNRRGRLLVRLNEVIEAFLANNLLTERCHQGRHKWESIDYNDELEICTFYCEICGASHYREPGDFAGNIKEI